MMMTIFSALDQELIKSGKKLLYTDLTKGTVMNLCVLDREKQLMGFIPSVIDFFEIKESDIVVRDINGNFVDAVRLKFDEFYIYFIEYQTFDDIHTIMHAHTSNEMVLAYLREQLTLSDYMIALSVKEIRVADYGSYGTI